MKRRWVTRQKLSAVHDADLTNFLKSLGVFEGIIAGSGYCMVCNAKITLENLGAVCPVDDNIRFICNHPSCLVNIQTAQE